MTDNCCTPKPNLTERSQLDINNTKNPQNRWSGYSERSNKNRLL